VDAAKSRMKELADFADSTPFELPQVARASRILETLTNGALSTGAGLKLVGDIAAGADRPFEEVAESVGRLHDALEHGTDMGMAMRSLENMGAITGDTKRKLEELQATGAKGDAVWAVAEKALGRFSGGMELQSHTWNGLLSTLHDTINHAFADFGAPILETLKPALEWAIATVKKLVPLAEEFGQMFQAAFQTVKQLFASGDLGAALGASIQFGFAKAVNFLIASLNGIEGFLVAAFSNIPKILMSYFKEITNPSYWTGLLHILQSIGAGFIAVLAGGLAPLIDMLIGVLNKTLGLHIDFNAKDLAAAASSTAGDKFSQGEEEMKNAMTPMVDQAVESGKNAMDAFTKAYAAAPKLLDDSGPKAALEKIGQSLQKNYSKIKAASENHGGSKSPTNGAAAATQGKVGKEIAADSYAKIGLFVGGNSPQVSEARKTNTYLARLIDQNREIASHIKTFSAGAAPGWA